MRCIVFPKYDQEAEAARLSPVPATEAFRRLMEAKCLIGRPPLRVDTLRELAAWIQARPAFTLCYSSLDDAAAAVAGRCDERQDVPVPC